MLFVENVQLLFISLYSCLSPTTFAIFTCANKPPLVVILHVFATTVLQEDYIALPSPPQPSSSPILFQSLFSQLLDALYHFSLTFTTLRLDAHNLRCHFSTTMLQDNYAFKIKDIKQNLNITSHPVHPTTITTFQLLLPPIPSHQIPPPA